MSFQIVRNDITKMHTEAIVNTANAYAEVGPGCDTAVYEAAGYDKLLAYRREKIGYVPEGEVFITPGFRLPAKYIIHAVSPLYVDGGEGEEERLRSCYRKSLYLAKEYGIRSIAFPLISTGSFGYPKEEGMRIAVDEIHAFLLKHEMQIILVVFSQQAVRLGGKIYPGLKEYIDRHYVEEKSLAEYGAPAASGREPFTNKRENAAPSPMRKEEKKPKFSIWADQTPADADFAEAAPDFSFLKEDAEAAPDVSFFEGKHETRLEERIGHLSDTFSEYLLYLIQSKHMENADVYKRAIVDKKIFSKIKNNADYHPKKLTALCLCVGARLNLDESRDLLSRAGYALSPCDKTDIIFSYFIENEIYDMIELDIQLEEHGLPCIIT